MKKSKTYRQSLYNPFKMQYNPDSGCYEREGFDPVRKTDILEIINSYNYIPKYITLVLERRGIHNLENDVEGFVDYIFFLDYPHLIESLFIVSEMYPERIREIINGNFSIVRTLLNKSILRSKYPEKTVGYLYMLGFGETPEVRREPCISLNLDFDWEYDLKLDFRLLCWMSIFYVNKNQDLFTRILHTFLKYGMSLDILGDTTVNYNNLQLAEYCSHRIFNEPCKGGKNGFTRLSSMYYRFIYEATLFDKLVSILQ